jgi:hypothetical protein
MIINIIDEYLTNRGKCERTGASILPHYICQLSSYMDSISALRVRKRLNLDLCEFLTTGTGYMSESNNI